MSTYFFPEICNRKPRGVLWLGASFGQVLFNAGISGLYLVQYLDCGIYHHSDTSTAVPSYTLLHTDTESCTQHRTVAYNYTHLHSAV